MKEKLYFEIGSENCYPLECHKELLNDDYLKEIILQEAKIAKGSDFMWCKVEGECIEKGSGQCGKFECTTYKPRNGKSGCCIHLINCYEAVDPELILTKNGLTPEN